MNSDDELGVVRRLLQEALARAERAEAECEELRRRPWQAMQQTVEVVGHRIQEALRDIEYACRDLERLHATKEDDGGF